MIRNYRFTRILFLYLACSLGLTSVSSAQEKELSNSSAAFELMKVRNQWLNSSNAGGLQLGEFRNYSEIGASYGTYSGNFHRPQEGKKGNDLDFLAEGATMVDKFLVWGKFKYTRSSVSDANFNASIIDPFRGMPYIAADTNQSDWKKQTYDLAFKISTPVLMDRLSFGLEVNYIAQSGAKQRDIRTENYFYKAVVRPGIVFSLNNHHHLGANFEYYNLKEEANPSNVNTYVDQQYYVLYGLGNSVSQIGSGRLTNYEGDNMGAGIQYNYQGLVDMLLSGSYNYKVEKVESSFTTPREDASVKERIWNTNLQLFKDFSNVTHFLTANYIYRDIDGIEAITQYDNSNTQEGYVTIARDIRSTYQTQTAGMSYDLTINRENEYLWKLGTTIRYHAIEDTYLQPRSEKRAESIIYNAHAKKNIIFANDPLSRRLLLSVDYDYSRNLSGGYEYNGSHEDYPVVTKLENRDADYLNASFHAIGASAIYSQQVSREQSPAVYLKGDIRYCKPSGHLFDDRYSFKISLGCNF